MENTIANRQATEEEIKAVKMAGTIQQFGQRIVNAGGFPMLQQGIDDPNFISALLKFHENYIPGGLNYTVLLKWFRENDLERYLVGGSLKKQIKAWEVFYRKFYGDDFHLARNKIIVDVRRLPAIKAGLEIKVVNSVQVDATPEVLTAEESGMTEAKFFFYRILIKTGINIWGKTGRDRLTKKTLDEVLSGYIPVSPEDFNLVAFKEDWAKECRRVAEKKGPAPKVIPGIVRLNFVDGRRDIPSDKKYVSQTGEVVKFWSRSYNIAVEENIRLVTPAQEILLVAKMFSDTGKYLAENTWEINSALLLHEEKYSGVSVAYAYSDGGKFHLDSSDGSSPFGFDRFRLSL